MLKVGVLSRTYFPFKQLHRLLVIGDLPASRVSKREHIGNEVILFVLGELGAEHQVEKLHRIGEPH